MQKEHQRDRLHAGGVVEAQDLCGRNSRRVSAFGFDAFGDSSGGLVVQFLGDALVGVAGLSAVKATAGPTHAAVAPLRSPTSTLTPGPPRS